MTETQGVNESPEPSPQQPVPQGEPQPQPGAQPGTPPPPPPTGGAAAPPLPPELQTANASKDERTWAMLCHVLALAGLAFPFGNILGPLIMWLIKREESAFVNFHGKQSLWFQIWVSIAVVALSVISVPLMFICIGYATALIAGLGGIGGLVYAVVGGVQVSGGKDFEYYWIGPWVRRSM